MNWFKKKKEELPHSFIYGKDKISVYRSWDEVPFYKFIQWMEAKTTEEKLMILTTVTKKLLQDDYIHRSMENMTIWSLTPPQPNGDLTLFIEDGVYIFPQNLSLLKHTYDQFAYVDAWMKPVYDLITELTKETEKESPDPKKITEITDKHTTELIKIYPNIIGVYCNVAKNQPHDQYKVKDMVGLVNNEKTTKVLTLGSFFLTDFMRRKTGRQTSNRKPYQKLMDILQIKKTQVTNGFLNCGVLLLVLAG